MMLFVTVQLNGNDCKHVKALSTGMPPATVEKSVSFLSALRRYLRWHVGLWAVSVCLHRCMTN